MRKTIVVLVVCLMYIFVASAIAGETHTEHGCESCHAPHRGNSDAGMKSVPLWNGNEPNATSGYFSLYTSQTSDTAFATSLNGASKLCMSCHDGASVDNYMTSSYYAGTAVLGTDLSGSHPISFTYDDTVGGINPIGSTPPDLAGTIEDEMLDINGDMQCTSCHDIHSSAALVNGGDNPNMLRIANDYVRAADGTTEREGGMLCKACHDK